MKHVRSTKTGATATECCYIISPSAFMNAKLSDDHNTKVGYRYVSFYYLLKLKPH